MVSGDVWSRGATSVSDSNRALIYDILCRKFSKKLIHGVNNLRGWLGFRQSSE